ncbi:hypothetical protein PVK06_030345 [Gossypium arboreum]|uniref:Uncharacterized protein n=1 Tax=Gossypium arboreum TaxID=29729 RepID=A0ABR0NN01_GOSAR|nr:hypothetical protein PVK06_030345 [Gossypium arboreum]
MQDATEVIVRKKMLPFTSKSINDLFNLPNVEEDEYYPMMNNINWDFLQQVLNVVTNPGSQWIIRKYRSHSCRREYLKPVAKGRYVQGCITNYDLERLVERVHELNTKPDTEESIDGTETEANSVTNIEEEESDKEPNCPKPVEGSENPELRIRAKRKNWLG